MVYVNNAYWMIRCTMQHDKTKFNGCSYWNLDFRGCTCLKMKIPCSNSCFGWQSTVYSGILVAAVFIPSTFVRILLSQLNLDVLLPFFCFLLEDLDLKNWWLLRMSGRILGLVLLDPELDRWRDIKHDNC